MILLLITIPLFSSFAIFLFGRYLGQKGSVYLSIISILMSLIISIKLLYRLISLNEEIYINLYNWIYTGVLAIPISLYLDLKSFIMIFLISFVTFIVISYSSWYMYDDPHKNRFLCLLLMFAVSMLILVTGSNFLTIFIGWESVGIFSYLLINYWYNSINSNKSAIKAILYNKIGDIGYLIGLSILFIILNDLEINNIIMNTNIDIITILLFFFLLAAFAKSAQIFFHPWLGDAMAGPTPVSALLHAATMVTAGVFILFRLESIIYLSPMIKSIIIIIGVFTIIFGGISSLNQNDIKKIIAFSTCSQLGYMLITNGLNSSNLGLYHLLTHGFFKALLFLTAGIIIHNFNNEQDIRKFGGFIYKFPISYIFILVGSLAILSFPFLSGFYSKDLIIEAFLGNPNSSIFIFLFMVFGAILTSMYSIKLIYYTFNSKPNSINKDLFINNSQKEIPNVYTFLLSFLVLGSIFLGFLFKDLFLSVSYNTDIEFLPSSLKLIAVILSFFGIFFIFLILKLDSWNFHNILTFANKRFFFDSIFNSTLVPFFYSLGAKSFFHLDKGIFEYLGPIGLIRVIYTVPTYYNKNDTNTNNNYFIYLLLSFLFLFACLWQSFMLIF